MSSPSEPGRPPDFRPPPGYGGYGAELQSYGQERHPLSGPVVGPPDPDRSAPPSALPPFSVPVPGPRPDLLDPAPNVPRADLPRPDDLRPDALRADGPPADLPQRPAVVGLATTLAATASLQWVCVLSFGWLVATAGTAQLQTSGVDGGVYHVLDRFSYRMADGLAWPLYLFPVASFVLSFVLLTRREWARLAFTATGALSVLWSGWWLRDNLAWWLIPAGYIALTVLVLWTADATRWYRWRPGSDRYAQPR